LLDFDYIEWDDPDDPSGNVPHIVAAGLTPAEVDDVLTAPDPDTATSDSSDRHRQIYHRGVRADGGKPRGGGPADHRVRDRPAALAPGGCVMDHGTERNRRRWEALTPEQRAAVEKVRAAHRAAEYRADEARVREAVRAEFPPRRADEDLAAALAALRTERERQGLSLTDVQERSRIDRATISKLERGEIPNPTVGTLRAYAAALGKRLAWSLTDLSP
jgi:hypothetical protein